MTEDLKNSLGLTLKNYQGGPSTLCLGCGHDLISKHIITACFQNDLSPSQLVKVSGIGCSSKIPAYFINESFAFNSMHGRMGAVATGAYLARRDLKYLGVSGDGDTGNIGLGGFLHLLRRNIPMVYIIANNGVFGLTKGQPSASADMSTISKQGTKTSLPPLDFCRLAIEASCGFVARSFSGDAKQLVPLLRAALNFKGTAVIDVISPCITFNNHDGSTKSYSYLKDHDQVLQELGYYGPQNEIQIEYAEGSAETVELHDGSRLVLKKLDSSKHNVQNQKQALEVLHANSGEIVTGLFYLNEERADLAETLSLVKEPLNELKEDELILSKQQIDILQLSFQ